MSPVIHPMFAVLTPSRAPIPSPCTAAWPSVSLLLLNSSTHIPRAASALKNVGKAFNTTSECVCTPNSAAQPAVTAAQGVTQPSVSHTEHIQNPPCTPRLPHLTPPATGKTLRQLLKNQRFMVLHTIMSYPGLGYFTKSRQNRLSSSHYKIKRYQSSSAIIGTIALRVTLRKPGQLYRLGGTIHALSVL